MSNVAFFIAARARVDAGRSGRSSRLAEAGGAWPDWLLASVLLRVSTPVMLIVGRTDGAPVLFAHCRAGRDGRLFRCLEFRPMRRDPRVTAVSNVPRREGAR